jgi:hypothetical protein
MRGRPITSSFKEKEVIMYVHSSLLLSGIFLAGALTGIWTWTINGRIHFSEVAVSMLTYTFLLLTVLQFR